MPGLGHLGRPGALFSLPSMPRGDIQQGSLGSAEFIHMSSAFKYGTEGTDSLGASPFQESS